MKSNDIINFLYKSISNESFTFEYQNNKYKFQNKDKSKNDITYKGTFYIIDLESQTTIYSKAYSTKDELLEIVINAPILGKTKNLFKAIPNIILLEKLY